MRNKLTSLACRKQRGHNAKEIHKQALNKLTRERMATLRNRKKDEPFYCLVYFKLTSTRHWKILSCYWIFWYQMHMTAIPDGFSQKNHFAHIYVKSFPSKRFVMFGHKAAGLWRCASKFGLEAARPRVWPRTASPASQPLICHSSSSLWNLGKSLVILIIIIEACQLAASLHVSNNTHE